MASSAGARKPLKSSPRASILIMRTGNSTSVKLPIGSVPAACLSIPFIHPCTPIMNLAAAELPVNVASTDRAQRVAAMDEIKRALEIAEQIPFRFLVQHIGVGGESFDERKLEAAITSIEHLRAFAKPLGVRILLENIPNELATPDRLMEFIHLTHFDDVGVCFDVGHAHIMSYVAEAFEILKGHIRSTHIHDNAKDRDSHLWPGKGSIDWKQTMELLRSAPQTPPLLLEIEADEKVNPVEKMGETFRQLGAA